MAPRLHPNAACWCRFTVPIAEGSAMDIELAGNDFLTDLTQHTRRVTLYRLRPTADLRSHRAAKAEEYGEFSTFPVRVGESPGLLVAGMSEDEPVDWVRMIRSLTDVDLVSAAGPRLRHCSSGPARTSSPSRSARGGGWSVTARSTASSASISP
jgi:hypothetical protein